jgi:uncharacterized membrane protein
MSASQVSLWKSLSLVSERYRSQQAIFSAIGLNLFISGFLAYFLNIGIDDAYSLDTSSKDLAYAVHQAIHFEIQAPLYFILLYLWRTLDQSIFFARLFSILCIALTLYTVNLTAKRYLPNVPASWVTLAVALHPYTFWAGSFIRTYALAILLSVLLMLYFYDGYLSERPKLLARWLYGAIALAACYTHYFLCFFFVAQGLTLLLLKRRGLTPYLFTIAAVTLCFLPMVMFLPHQFTEVEGDQPVRQLSSLLFLGRYTLWGILNHALPTSEEISRLPLAKLLRFSGFLTALVILVRQRHQLFATQVATQNIALISLLLGIVPILVGLFWWADTISLISPRYFYPLFIPVIFCSFAIAALCQSRLVVRGWFNTILIFSIAAFTITYAPLSTSGDWKQVANYLMLQEQANQTMLVFPAENVMPLSYYYRGLNSLVAIPRPMGTEVYSMSRIMLRNQAEITAALASKPETIWVVQAVDHKVASSSQTCQPDNTHFNCQILESFIQVYYNVVKEQHFNDSYVRLLQRRSEMLLPL